MANPWTYSDWNLTAQGELITKWGLVTAHKLAKEAGTTVGGPRPPNPNGQQPIIRNFILTKRIGSTSSGGKGYSGSGVPTDDLSGN